MVGKEEGKKKGGKDGLKKKKKRMLKRGWSVYFSFKEKEGQSSNFFLGDLALGNWARKEAE